MDTITTHQDGQITVMINGMTLQLTERSFDILVKLQQDGGHNAFLTLGLINEGLAQALTVYPFTPEDEQYLRHVTADVTELLRSFVDIDGYYHQFESTLNINDHEYRK